ncbi:hypothetical protein Acor_83680 [Acrocarpospora corrugata]|uniref:Uncharacterized protein n=1 Tax=Acrocarpospora corrugata TaxID=35763 RepID=A0A5M3WD88_9ACTN|nr:hypothetical protein [Acrocarpospora corrugata]GES06299.1 hypothetical protein Acor_83680 [Acrocarpospora corrugata]
METALKILLGLYILQALIKFINFFVVPCDARIERIAAVYSGEGRFIKMFDDILLVLMAVLVALQAAVGLEHLSFITGLGLTLTQVFFHRFDQPLGADRSPAPPVMPIKSLSYASQAAPRRGWRELLIQTALFVWALAMLITQSA